MGEDSSELQDKLGYTNVELRFQKHQRHPKTKPYITNTNAGAKAPALLPGSSFD
jgi:hypothetical protein